jgi:hypothetical protein
MALGEQLAARSLLALVPNPQSDPLMRLHPVLRDYLAQGLTDRLPDLHGKFLDEAVPALHDRSAADDLATLTASLDPYLHEHLNDHLVAARRTAVLGGTVFGNGLDGVTGAYLSPRARPEELARLVVSQFERLSRNERQLLNILSQEISRPSLTLKANLENPAAVGWGVILAADGDPAIREALQPLVEYRAGQLGLGRDPKILIVKPGESAQVFLQENEITQGRPRFERVPYYLLIAADPRAVPFTFQSNLDAEYATGRLHFDTADEYAAYVRCLIEYERAAEERAPHEVLLWAPEASLDGETSLSANFLVQPLADQFPLLERDKRVLRGSHATRDSLLSALSGPHPPALVFTASHGIGYGRAHPDQRSRQGALVTGDWKLGQPVPPESLVAAQDLDANGAARVLVHFAFASYSAGTTGESPRYDLQQNAEIQQNSPPFVAELPRRLLALGALAFIGHYGLVSSYSFLETGTGTGRGRLLDGYVRALQLLARGMCVGHALRDLHAIAVLLAASLADDAQEASFGRRIAAESLVQRWTAWQNARSTILIGDPAARIQSSYGAHF